MDSLAGGRRSRMACIPAGRARYCVVTIGYGRFENEPKSALIQAVDTEDDLANFGVGTRYYLTERFFLRTDYRRYIILSGDDKNDEFDEFSAGISFFF